MEGGIQKILGELHKKIQHLTFLLKKFLDNDVRQREKEKILELLKILNDLTAESTKNITDSTNNLQKKINELQAQLFNNEAQLEQKSKAIKELYQEILDLQAVTEEPCTYGFFVRIVREAETKKREDIDIEENIPAQIDIINDDGKSYTVNVHKSIDIYSLKKGQRLRLTPQGNALMALNEFGNVGMAARISDILSRDRVLVKDAVDEEVVLEVSANINMEDVHIGTKVLYDSKTNYVTEILPQEEKSALQMERVKPVPYDAIGGLGEQVAEFRTRIVLPRLNSKLYLEKYKADFPKGAAFHGPPGCGKTLLARAIAWDIKNNIGHEVAFFMANGPEFLVKWVGDSEHKVREPAEFAKTHPETLVLYVVDEIDAVSRTRGTGGHAGVNDSIVTQFNTILDGFVEIPNLIFIGISNRLDLIDSAMLRQGRLDLQLKIPRPSRKSAGEIIKVYLTSQVPLNQKYFDNRHPKYEKRYDVFGGDSNKVIDYMVDKTLDHIFGNDLDRAGERRRVAVIEFVDGVQKTLYMKDFVSGAILKHIINEAKIAAAFREETGGEPGITLKDLHLQVEDQFSKIKDQIGKGNSEQWARMADLPLDKPFKVVSEEDDSEDDGDFTDKA